MTWYELIIVTYGMLIFVLGFFWMWFGWGATIYFLDMPPRKIYNRTKLNWFGCYFLWFLEFLLIPHIWITIWLIKFFKWIFTVGRKD